jgi:F-type H+-transporting ATPase subunit delta
LFEIYGDFRARYNEKMNILEVTAVTAEPLSARLREKLVDKLGKVTGKKIVLSEKTDKSIIGGIVLRYANTEIDSSVKTRLDKLKAQIDGVIA